MRVLIVTSDFGGHEKGSRITDPAEIEAVLSGENATHVVQSEHEVPAAESSKPNNKKEA